MTRRAPKRPRDYLDELGDELDQFTKQAPNDAMGQLAEDGANAVRLLKRLFGGGAEPDAPRVAVAPEKRVTGRSERHRDCVDAEFEDVIDTTGEALDE